MPIMTFKNELRLVINQHTIFLNNRRYEKMTISPASRARLLNLINNTPEDLKEYRLDYALTATLYVFTPRPVAIAAPVTVTVTVTDGDNQEVCYYCNGEDEVTRWTWGFNGGYEIFNSCPECG